MRGVLFGGSMMCRLVSKLTAVALAVHVLLGCCWHHQHACGHGSAPKRAGDGATARCLSDHGGHQGRCGHEPGGMDHSHGRGGCEGSRCVFTADQPVRASAAALAQFRGAVTAAVAVSDGLPAQSLLRATALAAPECRPPLPTHLLHQVLLL